MTALGPVAAPTGHGVGAPVTHPSCPTPPSPWKPFTAPNAVVPDIAGLEAGTNHSAAAGKWAYPAATVHKWMTRPETAPKNKKLVFVTFDDGPHPRITPEELTNLEKAHVPATFFMITPQLQEVPKSLLERSLKDGNGLDIHSYSHDYHYLYNGTAAQKAAHITCDYDWALAQARDVLGSNYVSSGFRYPGGHMSWHHLDQADAGLAKRGAVPIDWNAMSGDADAQMPTTLPGYVAMVKKTIAESGNPRVVVILNHDVKQKTAEAMPSILAYLKSQGYEFGIIS
ncbi:MAG: polysaccharide deacetylase family protein [Acidipropionibacterium sp.]|jgi:peptidoglycan/xylan/chitin deacetylase (PgdA/CDA1 family)|nr:polysaccharide deacetylase family protein [Acidipropionibacterium sp.]